MNEMNEKKAVNDDASLKSLLRTLDRMQQTMEEMNRNLGRVVEAIDDATNTMEDDLKWVKQHLWRRP